MVDIEKINPGTPVAGPYNPGIRTGNLLFISGQGSMEDTKITEQTYTALENIKKIVKAAGGEVSNIVNTTIFLRNIKDFSEINLIYKKFFNDNGVSDTYPARTTVEVSNLPLSTMLIEINAIAVF